MDMTNKNQRRSQPLTNRKSCAADSCEEKSSKRWSTAVSGSLTVEATLVMPLVLTFLIFLLSVTYQGYLQSVIRYALDQVAGEVGVLIPLGESLVETAGGRSTDLVQKILDEEDRQTLQATGWDVASSLFLSPYLEKRLDFWIGQAPRMAGQPLARHQRQILLTWEHRYLVLELETRFKTFGGVISQPIRTLIPIWSEDLKSEKKGENEEQKDAVWEMDNFSRGRILREKFGGNLPFNYPVLSAFEHGEGRIIRSLDLTAPSYQDENHVRDLVLDSVNRLAGFAGHESQSKSVPTIRSSDILRRRLQLVVPKNSGQLANTGFWNELRNEAERRGVVFDLMTYGESHRFSEQSNGG